MSLFSHRTLLLLVGCVLLSATVLPAQKPQSPLASWLLQQRWQKRVVLLCAPNAAAPELKTQRDYLAAAPAGMQERDLVVREVLLGQLSATDQQYLSQELGVKAAGFTLVLVGKDGGVKRRETQPVSAASLFGTIDTMPMRRNEARRRP